MIPGFPKIQGIAQSNSIPDAHVYSRGRGKNCGSDRPRKFLQEPAFFSDQGETETPFVER